MSKPPWTPSVAGAGGSDHGAESSAVASKAGFINSPNFASTPAEETERDGATRRLRQQPGTSRHRGQLNDVVQGWSEKQQEQQQPPEIHVQRSWRKERHHYKSDEKKTRRASFGETGRGETSDDASGSSKPRARRVCQFCNEAIRAFDRDNFCRGGQKHAFCTLCIRRYVEQWVSGDTFYTLQRRFDGSRALPCPFSACDESSLTATANALHYLPNSVVRSTVNSLVWGQFNEKIELVADALTSSDSMGSEGPFHFGPDWKADENAVQPTIPEDLITLHSSIDLFTMLKAKQNVMKRTCQCCFERVDTGSARCCVGSGHFFCTICIRRYVEEWVYGGACYALQECPDESSLALPCMAPADPTSSPLAQPHYMSRTVVQQSLPELTFLNYLQKMESISRASSEGDEGGCIILPTYKDTPSLPPRRHPHESGSSTLVEVVCHQAAEAMTEAYLRRCPCCHTQYFKEPNTCNKVRCPTCRAVVCYICRQSLPKSMHSNEQYNHFCNHSVYDTTTKTMSACPLGCSKCALWSLDDDVNDSGRLHTIAADVANRAGEELLLTKGAAGEAAAYEIQRGIERLLQEPTVSNAHISEEHYDMAEPELLRSSAAHVQGRSHSMK